MSNIENLGKQWADEIVSDLQKRRKRLASSLASLTKTGNYADAHSEAITVLDRAISAALAASGGNAAPELPGPFFYYESDADGTVNWNEACVCADDVYTNAEYAAENETHGGKVYSEAQMRAYGKACAAASAPNAALVAALRKIKQNETEVFDEAMGEMVIVGLDAEEMVAIAVDALSAAGQEVK